MKKALFFLLLALITALSGYVYIHRDQLLNPGLIEEGTLGLQPEYKNALELMYDKQYIDAEELFSSLENRVQERDLAYLKLKKLQINLFEEDFDAAVEDLRNILETPTFPREVKAWALEGVFTTFLKHNHNNVFYERIFSIPELMSLKGEDMKSSLYALAGHGYAYYPTIVFGSNLILARLEELRSTEDETSRLELAEDTRKFVEGYLVFSEAELTRLNASEHREIETITLHTERARILTRLSRQKFFVIETNLTVKGELEEAFRVADRFNDPFYHFYTAYNYLDHVTAYKLVVADDLQDRIGDPEIFSPKNVSRDSYELVREDLQTWSTDRISAAQDINPGLEQLIAAYK